MPVEFDELDVAVWEPLAPHRISDATPVMPILRMLTVAVRLAASFLPCVLMSTVWLHPLYGIDYLATTFQQNSSRLLSWPVCKLCKSLGSA